MDGQADNLQKLGEGHTDYSYKGADATLLERFPNPFWAEEGRDNFNRNGVAGAVHIEVPEFTSLCPKTGQPDFATIIIDYTPAQWCVESKSLKLYMGSFRMHGEFHETCVARIANDLIELLEPLKIQIMGRFTPRGGIPFWPTATWIHPNLRGPQADAGRILVPGG